MDLDYVIFDGDGNKFTQGNLHGTEASLINNQIPTGGSLSIQFGDEWTNFLISEWLILEPSSKPKSWKDYK